MTIQIEPTRDRRRATALAPAEKAPAEKAPATPEIRRAAPSRSRTPAAQRAYARRAQREGRRIQRPVEENLDRGTGRASFVVLIIVVLTVGVAATLWLSTQAIADSYRLEQAKQEADRLAERAAALEREVTEKESAASLAERVKAMGMVPAGDPARLIVQPDGTVVLVGEPTPVQPPTPPADEEQNPADQGQDAAGQGQDQAGTPPAGDGQPVGAGQGAG